MILQQIKEAKVIKVGFKVMLHMSKNSKNGPLTNILRINAFKIVLFTLGKKVYMNGLRMNKKLRYKKILQEVACSRWTHLNFFLTLFILEKVPKFIHSLYSIG